MPNLTEEAGRIYFFTAQGFLAAQGFFAAQGFAAPSLPLADLSFVPFSAFLSVDVAHGFLAAQGFFAAHGFFAWAKVKAGNIKNPVVTIANIKRVTLFVIMTSSLHFAYGG